MRVLIDTNIVINREDDKIIDVNLSELLSNWNSNHVSYLIHELSITDIKRDKNERRREISLSKLKSYPTIKSQQISDTNFLSIIPPSSNANENVDNNLLYSLYKKEVNFLVTEDKGILKKSKRLGINNKTLTIDEARAYFKGIFSRNNPVCPLAIRKIPISNLNINDSFFNSLKKEYPFVNWWEKISTEGREGWVFLRHDESIGALLILKEETGTLLSEPSKLRLKICTLKVVHIGQKIGELLLKIAFDYARINEIDEIFLTHFAIPQDIFVDLITDYGFTIIGPQNREDVYLKKLKPPTELINPLVIAKKYFPSFYDGVNVKKHIVPIMPQFFERLFVGSGTAQLTLEETGSLITEKNTITKAYICNTLNRSIREGDVLLFYRTHDQKLVLEVGTVESIYSGVKDKDAVLSLVGKRSVYNSNEIEEKIQKPATVIIFRNHFSIPHPVSYKKLLELRILTEPPRSITTITHDKYVMLKKEGNINERFTVH